MLSTPVVALAFVLASGLTYAQSPLYGQCGGLNWTGPTTCVSGATCVYSNDWYSQCVPSTQAATTTTKTSSTKTSSTKTSTTSTKTSSTKTTTTKTSTTKTSTTSTGPSPSGVTTTLPASSGYVSLPTASVISSSFDGKMVKYDRKGSSGSCAEQEEEGEDAAVFILEAGAKLSNVIIGADQAEGIHCRGTCTLTNVWWEDVCEDAATFLQTGASDVSYVIGGGAFHASDKIFQHNGAGTVKISNFFASDFGKLYRACGNCSKSYERHVTVDNVCLKSGKVGVGINTNWGDTAVLSNIKTSGKPDADDVCCTYKGVAKGSEPSEIGCGSSYSACQYNGSVGSC
ncbi:putative pectate lyase [Serendipita vermifera]|nr:putative pectate lyase [Serendipita vermifera]